MITQIHMDAVASFRHATSLVTDKKINLVYGLNGTGKSTISNFLYDSQHSAFKLCKQMRAESVPVLVYNQKFIQDNFFVADSLKGIFSLSKENKAAEQKIADATKRQGELEQNRQAKRREIELAEQSFSAQKQQAIDKVWSIKQTYAGGDRVLEYCLEGLKGQKDKLFAHLQGISKPLSSPEKGVQTIRQEVEALKGDSAQYQQLLPTLNFGAHDVESDSIFGVSILGNADSEVADLIEKLGNSDWVKQGLSYLSQDAGDSNTQCPFCQQETISEKFIESVRSYFDETYQQQLVELDQLLDTYQTAVKALPALTSFTDHAFAQKRKDSISNKYQLLIDAFQNNVRNIEEKSKSPKVPVVLADTSDIIVAFNSEVGQVNAEVKVYNDRLKNRASALEKLRHEFWQLMRWQFDQTMERFEADRQAFDQEIVGLNAVVGSIGDELNKVTGEIEEAQKQTVNVDQAVTAINAGLLDLGIDDFSLQKYTDSLYRVVRAGDSKDAFNSLSEGEKMMISFLYFCELCKGKSSAADTQAQRVAVIDDPISSLSHVFVFNVGQLIRSVFFKGDRFSQVIVLTHSLYFFYELTDPNHERREKTQKLFRLSKTSLGSVIQEMKYEEIQNDYQAYWSVVNDQTQPPALVANCMRNIVEYFFNFVRKKDLNNVFQMPELQDTKYQAFCRYINRESHSLGQNIIDMKEFDYEVFKEGLRLVFEKTGYPDHFKAMSKC
ncbi:AAA family ATPase [Luteimonas kalidii]|uniref:AAA family ATPase n=1 Tax=Luteimonas kalidii TaxID=3042025 RepID=A0ABT6JT91_9GAMM|nr:AAA family ATPase [Luteimonas kalidii]MDH5833698.1 AAA family ATPase [Luteimonas kalidii]